MKAHPYIYGTRKSDLYLCEKLLTATAYLESLLSKGDEFVLKCCHMNKFTRR